MVTEKEEFRTEIMEQLRNTFPSWPVSPKDDFSVEVVVSGKPAMMNLHNIFDQVQRRPKEKGKLISDFIATFQEILQQVDTPGESFAEIKRKLFLVVRPLEFTAQLAGNPRAGQLAFCQPVLSDLAIYWALDMGKGIGYIHQSQFSGWNMDPQAVTRIAYENTIKAERNMKVECIGEGGLLISATSEMETAAHLIYEPANLEQLIREYKHDWLEDLLFVSIPEPSHILVAKQNCYEMARGIGEFFYQRYGRILSPCVYVLAKGKFIGKVSFKVGDRKLIVLPLDDELLEPARN